MPSSAAHDPTNSVSVPGDSSTVPRPPKGQDHGSIYDHLLKGYNNRLHPMKAKGEPTEVSALALVIEAPV